MNDRESMTEETLRLLLASNEGLRVAVAAVRDGVERLQRMAEKNQESISLLQVDVAAIKVGQVHYATKADVEKVRVDVSLSLETLTWRLISLGTVVYSGLAATVYYIARNVH